MFNCKLVQTLFKITNQSHFHFFVFFLFVFCCRSVFLFLQISPFSFIFCRLVLESKTVQTPRKYSKSTCHILIGSGAHMAAYKRPGTVQSQGSDSLRATSETVQKFSLSCQLDQIVTNSEKLKNEEKTLSFQNQIQPKCSEIRSNSQWFITESSSSNDFLCNSSTKFVANGRKLSTITEARFWEEEGKNSRILNRLRRRRRNHWFISGFQRESTQNRINSRISEESNQSSG